MAVYHVYAAKVCKGKTKGGASGLRKYLQREDSTQATQKVRYLNRSGSAKNDLVDSGHANLPSWAKNDAHFWRMADRHERQNGVIARTYQITLPRELSEQGRQDLAQDIREVVWGAYTHTWSIHNPLAKDGSGEQPHTDVMVCPRRQFDSYKRTAAEWFHRAAPLDLPPWRGGIAKDPALYDKSYLYGVREAVALLTNAALEREGIAFAVSHKRLTDREVNRDAIHDKHWHTNGASTAQIAPHLRTQEQRINRRLWEERKADLGITYLNRDLVRATVSQWLTQGRQADYDRMLERIETRKQTLKEGIAELERYANGKVPPHRAIALQALTYDEAPVGKGLTMTLEEERGHGR